MSPTVMVIIEAGLIFGGALVFAIYQLISVRRLQRRHDRPPDKAGDS